MVQVSLATLLGFKQVGPNDFKPRRISMFPPSYADRALKRYLRAQQLQAAHSAGSAGPSDGAKDKDGAGKKGKGGDAAKSKGHDTAKGKGQVNGDHGSGNSNAKSPKDGKNAQASANQTDMTYCYHHCCTHKPSTSPSWLASSKKNGKDNSKAGGKKHVQLEHDEPDSNGEGDAGRAAKNDEHRTDKQTGGKGKKKDASKDAKPQRSSLGSPPLFPDLSPPSPPASSSPTRILPSDLRTARQTDEAYVARWLGLQGLPFEREAADWLLERDLQRRLQVLFPSLTPKDGQCTHEDMVAAARHAAFAKSAPSPASPGPDGFGSDLRRFLQSEPVYVYRDANQRVFASDGRPVVFVNKKAANAANLSSGSKTFDHVAGLQDTNGDTQREDPWQNTDPPAGQSEQNGQQSSWGWANNETPTNGKNEEPPPWGGEQNDTSSHDGQRNSYA